MANFRERTQVFIDKNFTVEANRQRLIQIAKDDLQKILASGQGSKNYQTAVDGHEGNIDSAQRQITITFAFIAEAATFALSFLQSRVQKVSGKTVKSFWISINGRYIPAASFNPDSVPAEAEIVIGNTVPQWRRIDVNLVGTHTLRYRFPGDINDCVRAVKRQFGNAILAKRAYDYVFPDKYKAVHTGYRYQSPVIILNCVT